MLSKNVPLFQKLPKFQYLSNYWAFLDKIIFCLLLIFIFFVQKVIKTLFIFASTEIGVPSLTFLSLRLRDVLWPIVASCVRPLVPFFTTASAMTFIKSICRISFPASFNFSLLVKKCRKCIKFILITSI